MKNQLVMQNFKKNKKRIAQLRLTIDEIRGGTD